MRDSIGAFIRLATPVAFEAPDGKPVDLIFVLLVPEQANQQHLLILSELAQMFSDRDLRALLASEPNASTLHRHITSWQLYVSDQRRAAG